MLVELNLIKVCSLWYVFVYYKQFLCLLFSGTPRTINHIGLIKYVIKIYLWHNIILHCFFQSECSCLYLAEQVGVITTCIQFYETNLFQIREHSSKFTKLCFKQTERLYIVSISVYILAFHWKNLNISNLQQWRPSCQIRYKVNSLKY